MKFRRRTKEFDPRIPPPDGWNTYRSVDDPTLVADVRIVGTSLASPLFSPEILEENAAEFDRVNSDVLLHWGISYYHPANVLLVETFLLLRAQHVFDALWGIGHTAFPHTYRNQIGGEAAQNFSYAQFFQTKLHPSTWARWNQRHAARIRFISTESLGDV